MDYETDPLPSRPQGNPYRALYVLFFLGFIVILALAMFAQTGLAPQTKPVYLAPTSSQISPPMAPVPVFQPRQVVTLPPPPPSQLYQNQPQATPGGSLPQRSHNGGGQ